jgi:hypothetical protein
MHLPVALTASGLVSYWQFNAANGTTAIDNVARNNGTLINTTDAIWTPATQPFGGGAYNVQTEGIGSIGFTGTGLNANYTVSNGALVAVTRLDRSPNLVPTGVFSVYSNQYWVVNRYGTDSFNANLTFAINEDLTAGNEANPDNIKLYTRTSNSDSDWTLIASAISVNAAANTATFNGITGFSQFILAYAAPVALGSPQNVTIGIAGANIQISWDSVSGANSYKVFASDQPDSGFVDVTSGGAFSRGEIDIPNNMHIGNQTDSFQQNVTTRNLVVWTCAVSGIPAKFYFIKSSPDSR